MNDPYEKKNLWDNPDYATAKEALKEKMLSYIVSLSKNHRNNTWAGPSTPVI